MDLAELTAKFGKLYKAANKADTKKKEQQKLLFEAFDEALNTRALGRKVIKEGEIQGALAPEDYVKLYHPGWHIIGQQEGQYILEENPSLMKFTYLNVDDRMVYGRTVAEAGPSLDDERLNEEDPLLWERVTTWPEPLYSLVNDAIHTFTIGKDIAHNSGWVDAFFRERGIQRVLKDLNTLSDDDLVKVQGYIVPGSLSPRLVAPRKASQEELDEGHV